MEGIFTADQEKKIAELLDEAIKLKGILELIDGYVFKAIITFGDDALLDKLPENFKLKLSAIADAVLAEDVDNAEILVAEILNELVNIPVLDEDSEGLLFKAAVQFIVGAVIKWIEKKRAE